MNFKFFIPSILHFLVDFFSIYVLLSFNLDLENAAILAFLYDSIAFLLQPLLGAIFERIKHLKLLIDISAILIIIALFIPEKYTAIIIVGSGNALFHVSAGKLLLDKAEASSPLGVFISFGALGVGLASTFSDFYLFNILLFIFIIMLLVNQTMPYEKITYDFEKNNVMKKTNLLPLILIVLSVLFRGFFGFYTNYSWTNDVKYSVLIISIFVFLGKFLGGFILDKFKAIPLLVISLVLSISGFIFMNNIYLALLGILGTNLLMAFTLDLVRKVMPRYRAFGFGLLAAFLTIGSFLAMYLKTNFPYMILINFILVIINVIFLLIALLAYKKEKKQNDL